MSIPIDYNKMQKQLDRRHYMSQVYISNIETWKPTQLGVKTYGKWCDLVNWENLLNEKQTSSDDFMNLAVKRKWAEIYYSFEEKQNVCEPTKFGHDLFKTFEYWIDKKAQKRVARKKQINGVMSGFQKVLQGMPKVIQQISSMMASFSPPKKTKSKSNRRKKNKKNDDYNELYDDLLKGWS